jgi:hypothetical protein
LGFFLLKVLILKSLPAGSESSRRQNSNRLFTKGGSMNDIQKYLSEHPQIGEAFLFHNESLLQDIKNRFAEWHLSGDLFSRYLLALSLNQIVQDEGTLSKEILKAELQKHGAVWTGEVAKC